MRFACNRCGKRYASTDEPVPGRIYAIGCKCGHTIVVKDLAPGAGGNGAGGSLRADPFAGFHSGSVGPQATPPVRPRPAPPARNDTGTQGQAPTTGGVPGAAGAPAIPAPRPAAAPPPPPSPAPRPAAAAPAPPRAYDPVGASHGILLDVDRARALSSGSMASDSVPLPETGDDEEVSITFSDRLPLFQPRERPRPWLLGGATALAAAVVLGGAWLLFARPSPPTGGTAPAAVAPAGAPAATSPAAQALPAPAATPAPEPPTRGAAPASPPAATPPAALAAAPLPERASSPSRTAPPAAVPPPATAGAGPARGEARPSRRAATRRGAPPAPAGSPEGAPGAAAAAPSAALLDLLSRKADAPAAAPGPAEPPSGTAPGPEQVDAAIQASRADFDACARETDGSGAPLGSRPVVLTVTANPSGIVTAPRLDDPGLDGSPAGTCIRAAARKLVLPAFSGSPVRVRVPLAIAP